MVKSDPIIKEFYLATISYIEGEPILKIFGYTKIPTAPVKSFEFKIQDATVERVK